MWYVITVIFNVRRFHLDFQFQSKVTLILCCDLMWKIHVSYPWLSQVEQLWLKEEWARSWRYCLIIQTEIVPALSSWLSWIEGMTTEDPFWVSSCFPSFPDSMWLHWRAISSAAASSSELAVVDWTRLLWSAYTSFHSSTSTTDEWNLFQTTTF